MIFGKIEYLNLLPFHIFLKRYYRLSQQSQILHYKKSVPAKINKAFKRRTVDAAFISSIESKKCNCLDLGIIARGEVQSVLVLPGKEQSDQASASSNKLAKILNQQGQVLIGDAALKFYLNHPNTGVDLAALWNEQENLPFVFARLCYHKDKKKYQNLQRQFLKKPYKVPSYILEHAALKTGIPKKAILNYLTLIDYKLDTSAKKGLNRFLTLAKSN